MKKGISLIEVIISIAIIGGAIAVFAILLNIIKVNKTGSLYTAAYKLAAEELEAVRALPIENLSNRTDSSFINVLHNSGLSGAAMDADAISFPNILKMSATGTSIAVLSLPYNNVDNFELETNIKYSETASKAGILFRARDLENYYFYYLSNDHLVLEKNIEGVSTVIYETWQMFSADSWYKLKIVASNNNISLYLDDALITNLSEDSLATGHVALATEDLNVYFDNIYFIFGTETYVWNFDDLSIEEKPKTWQRFGINDLPNGSGTLTITEPFGASDIKKIDVTVSWQERETINSVTISSLKTE